MQKIISFKRWKNTASAQLWSVTNLEEAGSAIGHRQPGNVPQPGGCHLEGTVWIEILLFYEEKFVKILPWYLWWAYGR